MFGSKLCACCCDRTHAPPPCRVNQFRALLAATETLADAATAAATDGGPGAPHGHHQLSTFVSGSSTGSAAGYASRHGHRGVRHSYPGALVVTHEDSGSFSSSTGGSDEQQPVLQPASQAVAAQAAAGAQVSTAAAQLCRLAVSTEAAADGAGAITAAAAAGAEPDAREADSSDGGSQRSHGSSPFAGPAGAQASSAVVAIPGAIQGPLELLGELMLQAHASYSTCGLGSDGTNRLVHIVRQHMMSARRAGVPPVLYGAKITGGGSGGTVCVLGLSGPAGQAAIDAVVAQYREETGYQPFVFAGSSMGAVAFGHLRVKLRPAAAEAVGQQ